MTIRVSVTKEEDGSGGHIHVVVLQRDIYGNTMVPGGGITELKTGETRSFYLHATQEIRVYETDKELAI